MNNFHCIDNFDRMPPFFMSLVSASNIWAFISSTGGLTAGRKDAEHALFPYTTDDRITENAANTGPLTLIRLSSGQIWQPFSCELPPNFPRQRKLYKHVSGDALCFEEILEEPALRFRYTWLTSPRYGLVRKVEIENCGDTAIDIQMLDGVQNLLPAGVSTQVQSEFSNLLDAYKRSFLEAPGTLALYTLSSKLTDLAEPSEALRCTTAWTIGFPTNEISLSSDQVQNFRLGKSITTEEDVIARRGAFLVHSDLKLLPGIKQTAYQVFEVEQDHSQVLELQTQLEKSEDLQQSLETDITVGSHDLWEKISRADGCQCTGDSTATHHHFSNVVFNCLRGGLFPDGPQIRKSDLASYLETWQKGSSASLLKIFSSLPELIEFEPFQTGISQLKDPNQQRLCKQYLPLTFSRRHGDPSRPWNKFSINLTHEDGSPLLDYQGNWRDLFQNLEALLASCPAFIPNVVTCFLNATTLDGYNPYRVTRNGIEWEKPEPDNPWANIGYWGDHQIIYLLKLLEAWENYFPGELDSQLNQRLFSSADVPYRLLRYKELLTRNDGTTVLFDQDLDDSVQARVAEIGADGKMVHTADGNVHRLSLMEKLLTLTLAKLGNFVPEGGIWMNTQRPEWNDANNALAGRGISVVTLGYLHRHLKFLNRLLEQTDATSFDLSPSLAHWLSDTTEILGDFPSESCTNQQRLTLLDRLGEAATRYREEIYSGNFESIPIPVAVADIKNLIHKARDASATSLQANKRLDGMYHAYHVLTFPSDQTAAIRKLNLMLEGQVSILSSGLLSSEEALHLLGALRQSELFRPDQQSYILYPDQRPPCFMDKNQVSPEAVNAIPFLKELAQKNDRSLIRRDLKGDFHFHPDFRNAKDLEQALTKLPDSTDRQAILDLYETTFDHQAFTGRSGSMFGFEGLGSIYWHMVAKLLLAVQEAVIKADKENAAPEIIKGLKLAYIDVRNGLGFRKTPDLFGAFPTDPYSHTPSHGGAKQPGMTGQVKEEILTRLGELGLRVSEGCIQFDGILIPRGEFLIEPGVLRWIGQDQQEHLIDIPAGSFAFTYNQVPVLVSEGDTAILTLLKKDGNTESFEGNSLDAIRSRELFLHKDTIRKITVIHKY